MDRFSGYNQIWMAKEDQEKTTFVTEWGVFETVVMMFGLERTSAIFQGIIVELFVEYITGFMQFSSDFAVFSVKKQHLKYIQQYLQKCREAQFSINPAKCGFIVARGCYSGIL